MKALVLSGGGLFGAWQAGAWSVLARRFEPDVIVGASVGSLNGYLIACGVTPEELIGVWLDPRFRELRALEGTLKKWMGHYTLRRSLAVTVTDGLTLKAWIARDGEITWRHLAASCAVPLAMPQVKIDGRWCTDGGLLAPLPVWAAVELGATEIEGLQVLGKLPSPVLGPFVKAFRGVLGKSDAAPEGVVLRVREPGERLGNLKSTLWGTQADVGRWIEMGRRGAEGG